jgi:hypothetical protein
MGMRSLSFVASRPSPELHAASYSIETFYPFPGNRADHSPLSIAEVKNVWSYISIPSCAFMSWRLIKQKDNFTFQFLPLPFNLYTLKADM